MRFAVLLLAVSALAGCGGGSASTAYPQRAERPYTAPGADSGFNADDPALSLLPDSEAADRRMLRRLGKRADFRVPRAGVTDTRPGPLAYAVIARMWNQLAVPDPRLARLNAGQRALFALQLADWEILDGGFDQFWFNSAGWFGDELASDAHRVGAPEYERLFRDAAALFPGGHVPRDRQARQRIIHRFRDAAVASLDDRYDKFQYHRRMALGLILGRYVREHPAEFFAS